jgi:predicted GNAT family N-acyltransferase
VTRLALPDSAIEVVRADPTDPRIDAFSCGSEPWAEEVNDEIWSRDWVEDEDLWQFLIEEEDVAYARFVFAHYRHPTRTSREKAKYVALLAFGVSEARRHGRDPGNPARSIARTVLEYVTRVAQDEPDCVGLSLHVRAPNEHAREVYEHYGFMADPTGQFDEGGLATIEMRLIF